MYPLIVLIGQSSKELRSRRVEVSLPVLNEHSTIFVLPTIIVKCSPSAEGVILLGEQNRKRYSLCSCSIVMGICEKALSEKQSDMQNVMSVNIECLMIDDYVVINMFELSKVGKIWHIEMGCSQNS